MSNKLLSVIVFLVPPLFRLRDFTHLRFMPTLVSVLSGSVASEKYQFFCWHSKAVPRRRLLCPGRRWKAKQVRSSVWIFCCNQQKKHRDVPGFSSALQNVLIQNHCAWFCTCSINHCESKHISSSAELTTPSAKFLQFQNLSAFEFR